MTGVQTCALPIYKNDLDYLLDMLDWDANTDPNFQSHRLFKPQPVTSAAAMADAGYCENWVVYSTPHYSAKELTVFPGRSVTVKDGAAYGLILTQGYGSIGVHDVETPSLIRYGQMTKDELFVSAAVAQAGLKIVNRSDAENLVILKHFGPGNPDAPTRKARA